MNTLWTPRYAQRTQRMQSSAIHELLKPTENPDMISFAGGRISGGLPAGPRRLWPASSAVQHH
jgi:hypothetical protein